MGNLSLEFEFCYLLFFVCLASELHALNHLSSCKMALTATRSKISTVFFKVVAAYSNRHFDSLVKALALSLFCTNRLVFLKLNTLFLKVT